MKTIRTWFAICGLFFAVNSHAQTILSGNISGTWSPSGNPYVISANATVQSGQTLTIQPGVIVWIGQGISITVNGGIQAEEHLRSQSLSNPLSITSIGTPFP